MATLLNKDLSRESSELVEEKNIIITLTGTQIIELRIKGKRSATKSIGILDLYDDLNTSNKKPDKKDGKSMISLNDLRSSNLISTLSYEDKVKFEQIILRLIETS